MFASGNTTSKRVLQSCHLKRKDKKLTEPRLRIAGRTLIINYLTLGCRSQTAQW